MNNCTRCGSKLDEFKISISFNMKAERMKESSSWEEIPNLTNESKEIICFDCFSKFTEAMQVMNTPYIPTECDGEN